MSIRGHHTYLYTVKAKKTAKGWQTVARRPIPNVRVN
jgi:hypothetical protein